MTDPKKRLEEILDEYIDYNADGGLFGSNFVSIIGKKEAITEILKEFVYKDNLPTVKEIEKRLVDWNTAKHGFDGNPKYRKITLAEAIRKLIDGERGLIPGCDGKNCKVPEYMKAHDIKYGYCKICNPEEYKLAIEEFGDYTEVGENETK